MVDARNEGVNLEFIDALVDDPLANTRPDGYMEQPFIVGATEEETNLIEIARMLVNFLEASEAANVIPVEAGFTSIEIRDAVTTLIEIEQAIVSTVRARERATVAVDDPPEGKPRPVPPYLRDPKRTPPFGGGMDTGVFAQFVPYLGDALRADDADDIRVIAQIEGMPTLYNLLNDRALFPDKFNPVDYLWRPIRFAFAYAKRFASSPNVGRKVLLFAADKLFSATGIMSFLSFGAYTMGMSMNEVVLQIGGLGPDSEAGTKAVEAFVEKVVDKLDLVPSKMTGEGGKWQDQILKAAKYHKMDFVGRTDKTEAIMKTTAVKFLGTGKVDPDVLLHIDQPTMRTFSARLMRTFPSTLGNTADGKSTMLHLAREVATDVKGKSGPGRYLMFPLPFSEKQGRAASAMQAMTGDKPTVQSFVNRLGELPGPLQVKGNAVKLFAAFASFAIDHPILFGGGLDVSRSIINMILHQNAAKTATILAYGQKIIGRRDMPSGSLLGFVHNDLLNCLASVHRRDANPVRKAEAIRLAGVVDAQKPKLVVIRNALLGKSITNRTYGDLTDLRPPQGTEPEAEKYKRFLKAAKMIEQEVEELNKAIAELKPTSNGPYLGGTVTDCPDGDLEHEATAMGLSVPVVYGDENDTVRPPVDVEEGGGRGRPTAPRPVATRPVVPGPLLPNEILTNEPLLDGRECPPRVKDTTGARVIETESYGNCFYDSIRRLAQHYRITDWRYGSIYSLRAETANFFRDPRTGSNGPAYDAAGTNAILGITATNAYREIASRNNNALTRLASAYTLLPPAVRGGMSQGQKTALGVFMREYGNQVAVDETWANEPEVQALAYRLNVRICVYEKRGAYYERTNADYGPSRPLYRFALLHELDRRGDGLHYKGLLLFAPPRPPPRGPRVLDDAEDDDDEDEVVLDPRRDRGASSSSNRQRSRTNALAVYGMLTIDEMIDSFKASRV
jgi:hypothetical protein